MSDSDENTSAGSIRQTCAEFARAWDQRPRIRDYLEQTTDDRADLLCALVKIDIEKRMRLGETPHLEDYQDELAEDMETIQAVFLTARAADVPAETEFAATISHSPNSRKAAPAPSDLEDYEILGELGRGGMGVVFKARQRSLDRLVALKVIRAGEFAGDGDVKRFQIEAQATAQLEHRGIVQVYEVGTHNGEHFYSMAIVRGQSLAERLNRDGPLPPSQAAEIVEEAARAMHHAHERGVVHRDIKPHNILLDEEGRPKLTDFGLAKHLGGDSELTKTGQVMGTPSYMPPEQALGHTDGVDEQSDVYSLGAVLYATLTGRPPHQAANPIDTLKAVVDQEPVAPRMFDRKIPRDLETICLKALAKMPNRRYESAAAMADDLGRYLRGEAIVGRRVGRLEKAWLWCKKRPAVTSLAVLVLVVIAFGSVIFVERQNALYAQGLVDSLVKADAKQVTSLIDRVEVYQWWSESLLTERFRAVPEDSTEQLVLRLALLRFDESHVETSLQELLRAEFEILGPVCEALAPYQGRVVERLWNELHAGQDDGIRFRAGIALAKFKVKQSQWTEDDWRFLAQQLVAANPDAQSTLRGYLQAVSSELRPVLEEWIGKDEMSQMEQLGAANALADRDFCIVERDSMSRLCSVATPDQFEILYERLADFNREKESVQTTLLELAAGEPADELNPDERIKFGARRAGAAITLLRQGDRQEIFPALRVSDDPESLSQFVHRCPSRGIKPTELLECLDVADKLRQRYDGSRRELEDRVLFGLILALGEFTLDEIPAHLSRPLIDRLAVWHAMDASSSIHGATGWLLRHWGQDEIARKVDQTAVPYSPDRQWYTVEFKANPALPHHRTTYMTFIVIPAGTYEIGSSPAETIRHLDETRHSVDLPRPLAILDREITWSDVQSFNPQLTRVFMQETYKATGFQPTSDHPCVFLNWYETVQICRWLTKRAGLGEEEQAYPDPKSLDPQQYPPDPDGTAGGSPRDWPMVATDRSGYRLPTEAEWEIACRAGVRSAWSFGGDDRLLGDYGWYSKNSGAAPRPRRVRTKRPSLFGVFDLHGNVTEWCHDWYEPYSAEEREGRPVPVTRVQRGGFWGGARRDCRSASRSGGAPTARQVGLGFRVVTVPVR